MKPPTRLLLPLNVFLLPPFIGCLVVGRSQFNSVGDLVAFTVLQTSFADVKDHFSLMSSLFNLLDRKQTFSFCYQFLLLQDFRKGYPGLDAIA